MKKKRLLKMIKDCNHTISNYGNRLAELERWKGEHEVSHVPLLPEEYPILNPCCQKQEPPHE